MSEFLSLFATLFVALSLWKYVTRRKQHQRYPPGPKPMPVIGNVLDLPTEDVTNVYIEWEV